MKKIWAIGVIAVLIVSGIGLITATGDRPTDGVVPPTNPPEYPPINRSEEASVASTPERPVAPTEKGSTEWEELIAVGFYPQERRLCAVIHIKKPSGYNGENEYVHFWADWNNDGDYNDWGEDLGATYVPVTDPGAVPLPLEYSVYKDIIPRADVGSVVHVNATLGYGYDLNPNCGNSIETWIRVDPIR